MRGQLGILKVHNVVFAVGISREQEGSVPEVHKGKEEDLEHEFSAEN